MDAIIQVKMLIQVELMKKKIKFLDLVYGN